MRISESYRLNKAVLSIQSEVDGRRIARIIPSGAIIRTTNEPQDGLRLVSVLWQQKTVMIFEVDLRARSTIIKAASA